MVCGGGDKMTTNSDNDVDREEFYRKIDEAFKRKRAPNTFLFSRSRYAQLIEQVKTARKRTRKEPADYRRMKRFDIIKTPEGERLIARVSGQAEAPMFVTMDEMYEILRDYHLKLNHGGRTRMKIAMKNKYKNITTECVSVYISLCQPCQNKLVKRGKLLEKEPSDPIPNDVTSEADSNGLEESNDNDPLYSASNNDTDDVMESDSEEIVRNVQSKIYPELFSRAQVDILDVTTAQDEEYKYMLVYRNFVTKYVHLKPLKSTTIDETVDALVDIFLIFGAPNILQSKNGMAVAKPICSRILTVCPEIKVVAAEANVSKQDFKGKSNEDILRKLHDWLALNRSLKWQKGLKFVQHSLNTTFHEVMCKTPSELVFGGNPKKGLASFMSRDEYNSIHTESDLKLSLEQRENSEDGSGKQLLLEESLILPSDFINMKLEPVDEIDETKQF